MQDKKYFLGIDMGTDSVGWCLTDQNYKIIKKNGKSLWGVRLFKEAKDCSERRLFRTGRRRLARRKERINLLRDIFTPEITKLDKNFFMRLDYSKYYLEDRPEEIRKDKDYLFPNDRFGNNEKYFKKYPTIYHLRKDLITNDKKMDLRLIYLAFQHMIKYRGNFLSQGVEFKSKDNDAIRIAFEEINERINEIHNDDDEVLFFDTKTLPNELVKLYKSSKSINYLKKSLKETFNKENDKYLGVIFNLIIGGSVKLKDISFGADIESTDSICVANADFDSKYTEAGAFLDDVYMDILKNAKSIYDQLVLKDILGDDKFISDVMINRYNEHKEQLKQLKNYVKENYDGKTYDEVFRLYTGKDSVNNYAKYIGSSSSKKASIKRFAHCDRDEFYKFLKKELDIETKAKSGDEVAKQILNLIENKRYLLRQNSSENGTLPYQLNKVEMEEIIYKQSKFYPFFNEKDKDGNLVKDKIIALLEFKIPYYVGPLDPASKDEEHHKLSWSIRNPGYEHTKIVPWNFDKVINKDASAEAFIRRMQNKCTYLHDSYCMPKGSLLYGYYTVLQDLNNLTFNGDKIDEKAKNYLFKELYLKKDKVTTKDIKNVLNIYFDKDVTIGVKNGDIDNFVLNGSLKSINIFTRIFGSLDVVKKYYVDIEKLIIDLTLFEDKSIIKDRIKNTELYSEDFVNFISSNPKYLASIKGLRFEKYCSISRDLLSLKGVIIDENGVINYTENNVIEIMDKEGINLEEIINRKEFVDAINLKNEDEEKLDFKNDKSLKDYIDNLYVSPGMKRPLLQTVKIIRELEGIIKQPIDNFYIETTRTNKNKKKGQKQESRRDKLLKLLNSEAKKIVSDIQGSSSAAFVDSLTKEDDGRLQAKKIFLYYLQCGKDVYSGQPIDLNNLNNYDIDHIIPQARIKDDSLQNTVLVSKDLNNSKQDYYPIPNSIISSEGRNIIEYLHRNKELMSDIKYERLTRSVNKPLTEDELQTFANRQLTYTNQAVKALCDLIKKKKENAKVVYCKAENVTDFRRDFDLTKSRLANNFHHAHDAFLNIIVGDVYDKYFTEQFIYHNYYKYESANLGKFLKPCDGKPDKNGQIKSETILKNKKGEVIWQSSKFVPYIDKVVKTQFDIMVTEPTYFKKSGFYKQQILPKGNNLIPLKSKDSIIGDVNKYGGYQKPEYGFYDIIKETKGDIKLVPTPVYFGKNPSSSSIKLNTILKRDDSYCRIASVTSTSYNINKGFEPHFAYKAILIIKKINVFADILTENKMFNISESCSEIGSDKNKDFLYKANQIRGFKIEDEKVLLNNSSNYFSYVSREESNFLLDYLLKFIKKSEALYSLFSNCIRVFNKSNFDKIGQCPLYIALFLEYQLLLLLQRTKLTADFSLIGLGEFVGNTCLGNKLVKGDKFYSDSITGFYRKLIYEVR